MRDDELVALGVMMAVGGSLFALFATGGAQRHKERTRRLKVIEQALQHPELDHETRRRLVQVLTEKEPDRLSWLASPQTWSKAWFAVGWLMFVACGGLWGLGLAGAIERVPDEMAGFSLLGFAMLSLPLGLREMRRRELAEPR